MPLGSDGGSSSAGAGSGGSQPVAPKPVTPSTPDDGNGQADNFRYNGHEHRRQRRQPPSAGSTSARATASFCQSFDTGTFLHFAGDNPVAISADKTYARINSLTDIQELVTASKDLSVSFQKDTLTCSGSPRTTVRSTIALPGFADDYKSTFDDALF